MRDLFNKERRNVKGEKYNNLENTKIASKVVSSCPDGKQEHKKFGT
jgi:hypothetical protein